jgi:hypothetical protein
MPIGANVPLPSLISSTSNTMNNTVNQNLNIPQNTVGHLDQNTIIPTLHNNPVQSDPNTIAPTLAETSDHRHNSPC